MELFGNSTSIFTKTPTGLFYLSPVATSSSAFYLDVHSNWATFGDGFIIPVILSEPFSSLMKPNVLRQTTQLIIERQTWLAGDAPVQFPQCTGWLGRRNWLIRLVVTRQSRIKCCTLSKLGLLVLTQWGMILKIFFNQILLNPSADVTKQCRCSKITLGFLFNPDSVSNLGILGIFIPSRNEDQTKWWFSILDWRRELTVQLHFWKCCTLMTFQRLSSSGILNRKRTFWLFSFLPYKYLISLVKLWFQLFGNFPWRSSILQNPIKAPDYMKSLALEKGSATSPHPQLPPPPPLASAATIINIGIPFFIWLSRLSETLPKWTFFFKKKSIW